MAHPGPAVIAELSAHRGIHPHAEKARPCTGSPGAQKSQSMTVRSPDGVVRRRVVVAEDLTRSQPPSRDRPPPKRRGRCEPAPGLVEPAQPVSDRHSGLHPAVPGLRRVTRIEQTDLTGDEGQDLATLVVDAQHGQASLNPADFRCPSRAWTAGVQGPVWRRTVSPARTTTLVLPPRRTSSAWLSCTIHEIRASTNASGSNGARSSGPSPRPTSLTGTPSLR
jgi:hypothetical protein